MSAFRMRLKIEQPDDVLRRESCTQTRPSTIGSLLGDYAQGKNNKMNRLLWPLLF
jgi:hypothetical protein